MNATTLHETIQSHADSFARCKSQEHGVPFVWSVDATDAGVAYVSIWSPDRSPETPSWMVAPDDEGGLWELTAHPLDVVVASAASPGLLLKHWGSQTTPLNR